MTTHTYTYTSAVTTDGFGAPAAPLAGNFELGAAFAGYAAATPHAIESLLADVFTKGAIAAGQVPAGTATFAKYAGAGTTGWDWRYTKMYLDLEHEVAPATQAIGATSCTECHGASPAIPICELYQGVPAAQLPWGVTCP
jgi:hypothetical protein